MELIASQECIATVGEKKNRKKENVSSKPETGHSGDKEHEAN